MENIFLIKIKLVLRKTTYSFLITFQLINTFIWGPSRLINEILGAQEAAKESVENSITWKIVPDFLELKVKEYC